MKIINFRGDLTDISAKKALVHRYFKAVFAAMIDNFGSGLKVYTSASF